MLARASADALRRPGDLIDGGTVGRGCLLEVGEATLGPLPRARRLGQLRIERLGTLRNLIVARLV